MLVELRIRDFAIIDSLALPFARGLNVLTGETGAGKSIIVGALSVLVGERASSDLIRTGAERASVEGVFDLSGRDVVRALLDERGLDVEDDTVVLKREIGASRTRAWINGTPVTTSVLAEVGRALVNIHGQHEAQSLLDPGAQRAILDAFAGADELVRQMRDRHDRLASLLRDQADRDRLRSDAARREDWLRHVVRELGDAALRPGEDAELDTEMRRLSHAVELRQMSGEAAAVLDGDDSSLLARLASVQRTLGALVRIDPSLERLQEPLDAATYQIQELARDLASYSASTDADPERLAEVERRRDVIHRIVKKYGGSEESALAEYDSARRELALLDESVVDGDSLARQVNEARAAMTDAAARLSAARAKAGTQLAKEIEAVLPTLGLADGAFSVDLKPLGEPQRDGAEEVEFTVTLNVGHAPRPLARIASGGELSRVMLAVKTVLARLDHVPTLVFDEVDAGIGGAVALHVGEAMQRVAEHHQVFAITHLPQIAARAARHIVVAKAARGGMTTADTQLVSDDARVREVARMLGGDPDSAIGRQHASELLSHAATPESAASSAPTGGRTRARRSGRT